MSTITIASALARQRDIGRSRVFYGVTTSGGAVPHQWDGSTELFLTSLCDTEGPIRFEANMTIDRLTAPELIGDAALQARVKGERPVITLPAIYPDPAIRKILSPTYNASGGYSQSWPVNEFTIVIFAEELFKNLTTKANMTLDPNGGSWLLGGVAYASWTTRQKYLFGLTVWGWRAFPTKAPFGFTDEGHGKAVEEVSIELMPDLTKPEGHLLYTIGDPYLAADGAGSDPIDIEGGS